MTKPSTLQAIDPAIANADPDQAPDPFNLDNLRLGQNFAETAGVRKLLKAVPVHKPNPQDFVRVHPNPTYRDNFPVIELKDEREEYVVTADLLPELVGEFVSKTLFTAINRQGVVFLWPVRLPDPQGRQTGRNFPGSHSAGISGSLDHDVGPSSHKTAARTAIDAGLP
jgi:hypothetical protein